MNLSNRNRVIFKLFALASGILLACCISRAQGLSLGIVAGGSITSGFPNETIVTPPTSQVPQTTYASHSSDAGNYLIGAMAEIGLPLNLAVEADAIYRPLNFRSYISSVPPGGASSARSNTVVAWQFPVLLKYRAPALASNLRPVFEVGPSFRVASNLNDTSPANHGITGAGIEACVLKLRIAPAFRYTRWARDRAVAGLFPPRSNPNQVEATVGLSF